MPSRIPVRIDDQDFPSINKARLYYSEILHRNQPGRLVADPDQQEIKRLIASAHPGAQSSDAKIRVVQSNYGRPCFAIQGKDCLPQMISIVRSVKQCVSSNGATSPQP